MHETMLLAAAPPPLPESETSHGFARLRALRKKEQIQLVSGLRLAQAAKRKNLKRALCRRQKTFALGKFYWTALNV